MYGLRQKKAPMAVMLGLASLLWSPIASLAASDILTPSTAGVSFGPRASYFVNKSDTWDDGKFSGGAQLRFHFLRALAIEGSADYRREHFGSC